MEDAPDIKVLKAFCIYTYHWLIDTIYVLPPNLANECMVVPTINAEGEKCYVTQIYTLDHEITIDGRCYRFTSVKVLARKCLLVSKWIK